jgi:hypothetical protein
VENVTLGSSQVPDANGVGLETALAGYANWVNSSLIPGCELPTSAISILTDIELKIAQIMVLKESTT